MPSTKAAPILGAIWGQLVDLESELPPYAADRHRYSLCKAQGKAVQEYLIAVAVFEVSPAGGKWWRWKYRFAGKEKRLSFGVYPDVKLKAARTKRDASRQQLAAGIDPGEARKAEKQAQAGAESFEAIAREWHGKFSPGWVASHSERILRRLERDVFPWIGKRPIAEIKAAELLAVLRRVESRGALETTHRAKQNCGQVFRYAVATGKGRARSDGRSTRRVALTEGKASCLDHRTEARRRTAAGDRWI